MKCSALNYNTACLPDLVRFADACERFEQTATQVRILIEHIKRAQHFVLPEGGLLFDDNLRGMIGREFRLPYPSITVEYHTPQPPGKGVASSRRLAVATEVPIAAAKAMLKGSAKLLRASQLDHMGDTVIRIHVISWVDSQGVWVPMMLAPVVGATWQVPGAADHLFKPLYPVGAERPGHGQEVTFFPTILLPEVLDAFIAKVGIEEAQAQITNDVIGEISAVLELCEALTCINIVAERIQHVPERTNQKRIALGKLPLADAWCLTLKVPIERANNEPKGGTHRSPREHLRRGHIRHLDSGNIWVNSTLVNPGGQRIEKHYHVELA